MHGAVQTFYSSCVAVCLSLLLCLKGQTWAINNKDHTDPFT